MSQTEIEPNKTTYDLDDTPKTHCLCTKQYFPSKRNLNPKLLLTDQE